MHKIHSADPDMTVYILSCYKIGKDQAKVVRKKEATEIFMYAQDIHRNTSRSMYQS